MHDVNTNIVAGAAAALAVLALLGTGCGGRPGDPREETAPGRPGALAALPLERLFVLEMGGAPAGDTVVTFAAASPRTVVLRHAPPDNTVFAELEFPAELTAGAGRDSVRVAIRPRPGVYGIELATEPALGPGARLTFKYPVHFSAPAAARARYGSNPALERALAIARLGADAVYTMLPSERPAADNLAAALPGPGTYLVVAPR